MNKFFGSLFEWWNQLSFFSRDMKRFLKGYDALNGDYSGSPRYMIVGLSMIAITALVFIAYYFLFDSARYQRRIHWSFFLFACMLLNFIVAFSISTAALHI